MGNPRLDYDVVEPAPCAGKGNSMDNLESELSKIQLPRSEAWKALNRRERKQFRINIQIHLTVIIVLVAIIGGVLIYHWR